jgi:hypothetical protein
MATVVQQVINSNGSTTFLSDQLSSTALLTGNCNSIVSLYDNLKVLIGSANPLYVQFAAPQSVTLTSTTITGSVAVTGTFWQATQPVSLAALPALVAGTALVGKVGIDQTTPGTTDSVTSTHAATLTFKFVSSGGQVVIPATPLAYPTGNVIGTLFTVTGAARVSGGGGIILKAMLAEMLGASAYKAQAVTLGSGTTTVTLTGHTLIVGNKIQFAGSLPSQLTPNTNYFVQAVTTNTFTVNTSPAAGSAINFGTAGSGVTISEVPAQLQAYLYLFQANPGTGTYTDNIAFAPNPADWDGAMTPALFSSYVVAGQQAISDAGFQEEFKTSGSANLYAILVDAGQNNQALSKQAYLRLTLQLNQD